MILCVKIKHPLNRTSNTFFEANKNEHHNLDVIMITKSWNFIVTKSVIVPIVNRLPKVKLEFSNSKLAK